MVKQQSTRKGKGQEGGPPSSLKKGTYASPRTTASLGNLRTEFGAEGRKGN